MKILFTIVLILAFIPVFSQNRLDEQIDAIENKVIQWRRYFHEYPELSNREFNTAKKIAKHLKKLGIKVQTGIAKTGVVGILNGKRKGKVVALRADIDALPITERVDIPFRSRVTAEYRGQKTGVMHACGHDAHIAILMGVAEILSKNNDFSGTVKFIFQPAEEGAPPGEEGGAEVMVKEGVLRNPDVDVIFGLHIISRLNVGYIQYKPKGIMAASQSFEIHISGKQSHGSRPWAGIDPILTAVKIIDGLQTIISRETELTKEAAVLSIGKITSGIRSNIIPEKAYINGTLRTLDYDMQTFINKRMKEMVPAIANAYRAEAQIEIEKGYPITYNDPELTVKAVKTLNRIAGPEHVLLGKSTTGAEDFSFYQKEIPGFYFFLGGKSKEVSKEKAPSHHTPDFYIDESSLMLGVKSMVNLALDYMQNN